MEKKQFTIIKLQGQGPIFQLLILFLILGLDVTLHVIRGQELSLLKKKIIDLEDVVGMPDYFVEDITNDSIQSPEFARRRRQVEVPHNLNEDGVPIVSESLLGRNTEGLRIYEGFFQEEDSNQIPKDDSLPWHLSKNAPIKPHHRVSASWVENDSENSVNSNTYPIIGESKRSSSTTSRASRVAYATSSGGTSAYSQAASSGAKATQSASRGSQTSSQSASTGAINIPQDNYYKYGGAGAISSSFSSKVIQSNQGTEDSQTVVQDQNSLRAAKNRASVRSMLQSYGNTSAKKYMATSYGPGISSQFSGLNSVHYVMDVSSEIQSGRILQSQNSPSMGTISNVDGVFSGWKPARWVQRMNRGQESKHFPIDDQGRMAVQEAGVYFIYAQVAYLDEHDVNAYHVIARNQPFLLCTVMTQTTQIMNKANTCYTSGIMFLEKGDQIYLKDLESGRNSVLLPAHSFFGAIQLSAFTG